jgi:hypothetical protein
MHADAGDERSPDHQPKSQRRSSRTRAAAATIRARAATADSWPSRGPVSQPQNCATSDGGSSCRRPCEGRARPVCGLCRVPDHGRRPAALSDDDGPRPTDGPAASATASCISPIDPCMRAVASNDKDSCED